MTDLKLNEEILFNDKIKWEHFATMHDNFHIVSSGYKTVINGVQVHLIDRNESLKMLIDSIDYGDNELVNRLHEHILETARKKQEIKDLQQQEAQKKLLQEAINKINSYKS